MKHLQTIAIFILFLTLLAGAVPSTLAQTPTETGRVRVIVTLRPGAARLQLAAESVPGVVRRFERLPGVVSEVTPAELAALVDNPTVAAVAVDMPVHIALAESSAFIHADTVHTDFGLTGAGVNVAVLDTGLDLTHPDLAGRVAAQHCFNSQNTCLPDLTAESDNAQDEHGHGTHVAGIIAGQGVVGAPGIAPGVGLVAVRVLDKTGSGYTSDILAGIDWVLAHQAEIQVQALNLSLGGGRYAGSCDQTDATTQLYAAAIDAARQAGISVVAASGNQGYANELLAPACVTGAMAVGNVYHAPLASAGWPACTDTNAQPGQVACSSNSSDELDILAPGTRIVAPALGGGLSAMSGTSMSTPHVTAVAALLWQARPDLTPDALEALLRDSGTPTVDARNNRTTSRLDALAAVQLATGVQATPITGAVLLQGRTDNSGVQLLTGPQPCDAVAPETLAATTGPDGRFEIPAGDIGCMLAVHPGYLAARLTAPSGELPPVELPAGDLNGDAVVNILDLALIAVAYQGTDPAADVNANGVVDLFDLTLAAQNFNRRGPIDWP